MNAPNDIEALKARLREEIARIIDPVSFSMTPEHYDCTPEDFKRTMAYGGQLAALDKADAILALALDQQSARIQELEGASRANENLTAAFAREDAALNENIRLRAENERLTKLVSSSEAERYRSCEELLARALAAEARAEKAGEDKKELEELFDLRWKADMRAIQRWRKEGPNRELVLPDHADLVVWLLGQLDTALTALRPFAAFAEKARRFIQGRVDFGGSPIMPTKQFRLADFERAESALSSLPKESADG